MRSAILIAYIADVPHVKSGGKLVPVDQSGVDECKSEFKGIVGNPDLAPSVERVEVWTSSSGLIKRGKIRDDGGPAEIENPAEPEKKKRGRPAKS